MSKKYDQRASIKLDPANYRELKKLSGHHPLRPSMAKLANALIRTGLPTVQTNNNRKDRHTKGRTATGKHNGKSVLTEHDVRLIRAQHVPGKVGKVRLARRLKLPVGAVHNVLYGGTWRHVV